MTASVALFDVTAPQVWATCLAAAALLILTWKVRRGVWIFLAVVLVQVGLVGLLGHLGRTAAPLPVASAGSDYVNATYFPIVVLPGALDEPALAESQKLPPPTAESGLAETAQYAKTEAPPPLPPLDSPPPAPLGEEPTLAALTSPGITPGLVATSAPPGSSGSDSLVPLPPAASVPGVPDFAAQIVGVPGGEVFPAVAAVGGRIVFVIDRSGSMVEKDARGKSRLDRVKRAMLEILDDLSQGAEFQILFFNHSTTWLGGGAKPSLWIKSKDSAKAVALELQRVQPEGGTTPLPALTQTLQLAPTDVFFLTDGEFSYTEEDAKALRDANVSKTRIHGTLIGEKEHAPVDNPVEAIVKQHKGNFLYKKE